LIDNTIKSILISKYFLPQKDNHNICSEMVVADLTTMRGAAEHFNRLYYQVDNFIIFVYPGMEPGWPF
jgi:hypothetical protein